MNPVTTVEAHQAVRQAIEELNALRDAGNQISSDLNARLFGEAAPLDSLGLVTLLLDIEDRIASSHGITLSLADDRAMSEKRSPFRSVSALVEYIVKRTAPNDV